MKAEYTVKIGNVFYKAGDELPNMVEEVKEVKAVEVEKSAEPPVSPVVEKPVEEEQPSKRKYSRRK